MRVCLQFLRRCFVPGCDTARHQRHVRFPAMVGADPAHHAVELFLEGIRASVRRLIRADASPGVPITMVRIGLTGSLGCGKSTVLGFFKDYGAPVASCDAWVRRELNVNITLMKKLTSAFGPA